MNQLLQTRENLLYKKVGEEFKKVHEIIFLVDDVKYSVNNESVIVRERGIKELRMVMLTEQLDELIEQLKSYRDIKEEDLH
jgi:hypothetical protein